VTRLIRVSFGPFQLAELKAGEVEEIRTRTLREQLGERLVAASGVDFSMPLLPQSPTQNDPRRETTPRKPPSHSWRAHEEERPGKKFQRKFHGARRDDETPRQPPADEVRAELLTDRKGRHVPVERHGQPPSREPPQKLPEKRGKHGRRRSSADRASGPRRSYPKGRR
jgi:23S rRNA pseudouridine2605 synthase